MARDYAARNRKPAARPAGLPGWVWLVAGLSMGLVVAVIVYIARPAQPMPMAPAAGASAQAAKANPKVEIPIKEKPRFDFYTLLANEQVVVSSGGKQPKLGAMPDPPAPASKPATPAQAPSTAQAPAAAPVTTAASAAPTGSGKYLVLAGSFREQANAEQHRAQLAIAGIEARIERIQAQDGGTWHRVRIGPQPSQDRAEAVLAQMRASGFDGKLLKSP